MAPTGRHFCLWGIGMARGQEPAREALWPATREPRSTSCSLCCALWLTGPLRPRKVRRPVIPLNTYSPGALGCVALVWLANPLSTAGRLVSPVRLFERVAEKLWIRGCGFDLSVVDIPV